MLTEKELLTRGISIPKKEEKAEMALPPLTKQEYKKKKGLFSSALFKESLHSNRLGLLVVSLGNALIMVIIITILSTLHINATSSALADLFDNADYENTVKSGAISLYSSYSHTAESYELFLDNEETAQNLFQQETDLVNDSSLRTSLTAAKLVYDTTYTVSSGDEATKNLTAKTITMQSVDRTIDAIPSYSEEEKEMIKNVSSIYFDIYAKDKSQSMKSILKETLPIAFSDTIAKTYSLDDSVKEEIRNLFVDANDEVFQNNRKIEEVKVEKTFSLIPLLANEEEKEFSLDVSSSLSQAYSKNKEEYLSEKRIEEEIVSECTQKAILNTLENIAYYNYLPNFTVDYKTSDLGWPIRLVPTGRYADNGNEIMEEKEVKVYNPDVFIKEQEKMGKTSSTIQKMRKEALTGTDYTEEEIAQAKDQAKEDVEDIKKNLASFMVSYRKRENGKNAYFDGTNILKDNIKDLAIGQTSSIAEKTLIDSYNDKNDVKISSLEELTVENSTFSGKEMITLVKGYASSGISAYDTYYSQYSKEGYSAVDCNLLSLNKASQGVMALLPTSVDESLKEMGNMNTYGIIVGVVAFGIAALLIPMVYTILLAKSLVSEKVETGSLAFTLSTPTTRDSFIFTQACYLLFSEIVMAVTLFAFTLLTRQIGILAGSADIAASLPIRDIALYALGNFSVCLAVSGINFLASCHFNKTSQAIGFGGGLTIFFFICSILGLFATKAIPGTIRITMMQLFNYMTIDSLFDALAVMSKDYGLFFFKLSFLFLIAIVAYILGGLRFRKKDLPL